MTNEQQQFQRIQVWERYEAANRELAAQRARTRGWEKTLQGLVYLLQAESLSGIDSEYAKLPTHNDFNAAIAELKITREEFRRAIEEAKRNGFPALA